MKRRRFLITSGSTVLAGKTISNLGRPAFGLEFELTTIPNREPINIESVLIDFSKFKLTPQYVNDSKNAVIKIDVTIGQHSEPVSFLVSANITLLLYHLKQHGLKFQNATGGTLGSLLGIFGAGCASCGTALLTAVFSVFGISGALTVLPLHGGEFLIIAIIVSLLSIIWMSKGLKGGMVRGCPI